MTVTSPRILDDRFLQQLAQRAQSDAFVARHCTLADVTIGIRLSGSTDAVWLHVTSDQVESGRGDRSTFTFVGDEAALRDLSDGFPFNRLVRQHRLTVEGDLRHCVQNWLLIHAVLRLCHSGSK